MGEKRVKIAIIRFSSFGDILCTGPAVRGIRNRFPDAEITYVTLKPFEDLVSCLPGVDHVETVDKKGEGFDKAVKSLEQTDWDLIADLQGSPRSKKLVSILNPKQSTIDTPPRLRRSLLLYSRMKFGEFLPVPRRMIASMSALNVEDDGGSLQVIVPEKAIEDVLTKFGEGIQESVVFVSGAKHKTKMWPGNYWLELVKKIEKKHRILFIGNVEDVPAVVDDYCRTNDKCLNLTGKTTILEAAALMANSKAVVSGDTGPMHMAVALGKPLVTMFGPTVEEFGFFPFRAENCIILQREMWCRPCSAHGSSFCWRGHHKCLRNIEPNEVAAALDKVLAVEGA